MDLLNLGTQSRKTGLRARPNIRKDKYDMEDINDFFSDEETKKDSFDNVARRINFTDDEAASFNLPPISLGPQKKKNKKSPLRSPLPERRGQEDREDRGSEGWGYRKNIWERQENIEKIESIERDLERDREREKERERERKEREREREREREKERDLEKHDQTKNDLERVLERDSDEDILAGNIDNYVPSPTQLPSPNAFDDFGQDDDSVFDDDYKPTQTQEKPTQEPTQTLSTQENEPISQEIPKGLSEEPVESSKMHKKRGRAKTAASLTKRMALGTGEKRGRPKKPEASPVIVKPSLPSPPPENLRRSKRTKIAPLAFWRNERIVYTRAYENGQDPNSTLVEDIRKIPLQEIKEVVHYPEVVSQVQKDKRRKKKTAKEEYDYESDPEVPGSEWFAEGKKSVEDDVVAYTASAVEFRRPESTVGLDNFELASLFGDNKNFSAAGMLSLPVEGVKSMRNSGDIVYNFHVVRGLVEVALNSEVFVVTKGCSFRVPARNSYGFKNMGNGEARLYFVQARVPEEDDF